MIKAVAVSPHGMPRDVQDFLSEKRRSGETNALPGKCGHFLVAPLHLSLCCFFAALTAS
jgi:hypothetical protein